MLVIGARHAAGQGSSAPDLSKEASAESILVWRTYVAIHEHPELGKQEHQTHDLIKTELQRIGYTNFVESVSAPTAVITTLDTGRPGPVIALRAEMDARPTQEPISHSPRSSVEGAMHNCGHDAHAAMLLGVAHLLREHPDHLRGRIVFIFQPAEETKGGADDLVNEGILRTLGVQAIFAQHAVSGQPVGTESVSSGPTMAGSSYFVLHVTGRGSHAAQPSAGDDVLLAASSLLRGLADLPARRFDLIARPIVISPTFFSAGTEQATNVLPSEAVAKGTIRAFEAVRSITSADTSIERVLQAYVVVGECCRSGELHRIMRLHRSPRTVQKLTIWYSLVRNSAPTKEKRPPRMNRAEVDAAISRLASFLLEEASDERRVERFNETVARIAREGRVNRH